MNSPMTDQRIWDAFVEAKRRLHRRQAEFYQQAGDRQAVLRAALTPGADIGEQGAAFDFLKAFPGDVVPLLPEVFRWAVKSERWAVPAQEVISRIPRARRTALIEPLFLEQLEVAEDDDYPNLAGLAARCEAWPLLARLARHTADSDNPEVLELVQYYRDTYGPLWIPEQ
ncbi:hypothetical protein [Kitasatospora sp. NPDC057223]|uniref:hypothetical protein n=1 Tax=Kitasatospora sp. NPDC057223 TaxID=3346055 RepID=UPI00363F1835